MIIQEIKNKKEWENFLLECDEKTFLQSWNWGEFNKISRNKIWRLGIYEPINNKERTINNKKEVSPDTGQIQGNNRLIGVALTVKIKAKRGSFLFIPHGPITKHKEESIKY